LSAAFVKCSADKEIQNAKIIVSGLVCGNGLRQFIYFTWGYPANITMFDKDGVLQKIEQIVSITKNTRWKNRLIGRSHKKR
jgi:hypothetical protein